MKKTFFTLLVVISISEVFAESTFRFRALQASPLLSDSSEKGKFKAGNTEIQLETPPGTYKSIMISVDSIGFGTSSITTRFNYAGSHYSLQSNWLDAAIIIGGPGNTSLTFGGGTTSSGKGTISNSSSDFTSNSIRGISWFGVLGLEYVLPLNLGFTGLNFTEVLLGYRQNRLDYKEFKNGSVLDQTLHIDSAQYQFGIGFVF